jgi:molybdopterin-guanine dinucleotide biosynthesis protein A
VVVAKESTPLPDGLASPVWIEPEEPLHPRAGVVHALERAEGRAVLVCAGDLPLVSADLVRRLVAEPAAGAPAVVPRVDGRAQPLLARYEPAALAPLRAAAPDEALTATVLRLQPRLVDFPDPRPFLNVNTPEDLAAAAQFLSRDS